MSSENPSGSQFPAQELLDFCIRLGLIILAVVACERVFAPFLPLMLWAMILAVSLYPLVQLVRNRTGWGEGRASTVLVLATLLLLGVPTVALGVSFADHVFSVVGDFDAAAVTIKAPPESVRDVPLIGEHLFDAWALAHSDLPALIESLQPQLGNFARSALKSAASTAGTLFFFIGSLIVAGIMMGYGRSGAAALGRIFKRIAGDTQGPALHRLSTLTIRSVALGVVGVAFIQALLLGIGFLMAGIPAAGLLALIVMVIGILQLPALIVSLPAIAYIWMTESSGTVVSALLTVYLIVAGAADGVLKPMLLGRGVDVPMPVVLIGALGGMVSSGIVGLFVGAVILSVGYELFMGWVDDNVESTVDSVDAEANAE